MASKKNLAESDATVFIFNFILFLLVFHGGYDIMTAIIRSSEQCYRLYFSGMGIAVLTMASNIHRAAAQFFPPTFRMYCCSLQHNRQQLRVKIVFIYNYGSKTKRIVNMSNLGYFQSFLVSYIINFYHLMCLQYSFYLSVW